jgi:predicted nucleotidyltransferase
MNFHSDKWIYERLSEHYQEALTIFPKDKILGIFIQGSQNYGLDYEGSDIDTKCIVLPTLEDICLNKKATSYTHVRENNEHIDFKDLRVITGDFKKQNINFLEILFTKYWMIHEDYYELFKPLLDNAEAIARYDNYRFVRATAGMSMEKYKALTLDRPSQHDEIVEHGWATKQLHHIMRLNTFMKRWKNGTDFASCLIDPLSDYLVAIKQNGHSMFDLNAAQEIAKILDDETNAIKEEYIATHEQVINEDIGKIIDDVVVNIIRESLKKEIG